MEKELILKNRLKEIRTEQGLSQAKLAEIVTAHKAAISEKVLADEILIDTELSIQKEWNVNGEKVVIGVEKW